MSRSYREVPRAGRKERRETEETSRDADRERRDDEHSVGRPQSQNDEYHDHDYGPEEEAEDPPDDRNRSVDTRFKKGNRGGPGRPKGARNLKTIVRAISSEKVAITTQKGKRKVQRREVVVRQVAQRASQGEARATEQFLRLDERYGPEDEPDVSDPEELKLDLATLRALVEFHELLADDNAEDDDD